MNFFDKMKEKDMGIDFFSSECNFLLFFFRISIFIYTFAND